MDCSGVLKPDLCDALSSRARRKHQPLQALRRIARAGGGTKKEPPEGGSRCSQGGVKQSGQEPLNVQKLDSPDNPPETLTNG